MARLYFFFIFLLEAFKGINRFFWLVFTAAFSCHSTVKRGKMNDSLFSVSQLYPTWMKQGHEYCTFLQFFTMPWHFNNASGIRGVLLAHVLCLCCLWCCNADWIQSRREIGEIRKIYASLQSNAQKRNPCSHASQRGVGFRVLSCIWSSTRNPQHRDFLPSILHHYNDLAQQFSRAVW